MAMTVKVNFLDGFAAAVLLDGTYNYIAYIEAILRGATTTDTVGSTTTITDHWSGGSIRVETSGGLVDRVFVKGETEINGSTQIKGLIDIHFTREAPAAADLLADFADYAANWTGLATIFEAFDGAKTTYLSSEGGLAILVGHSGNETFDMRAAEADDPLSAGSLIYGSAGNDSYKGGEPGTAQVSYEFLEVGSGGLVLTAIDAISVKIDKPDGSHDTLKNIAFLTGSEGGDDLLAGLGDTSQTIFGGSGEDSIGGGAGDDYLSGDAGHDLLVGRGGDDVLVGGVGRDKLKGGAGNDVLIALENATQDYDGETDILIGGAGRDLFIVGAPFAAVSLPAPPAAEIRDFRQGVDLIGLGGTVSVYNDIYGYVDGQQLTFDDLVFTDTSGGTMISAAGTDIVLVRGNAAADFDRLDFIEAPALSYGAIASLYYDY